MTSQDLTLAEGLLLLALKDETGERTGSFVEYALAGSAIAELVLRGVLAEAPDKPAHFILADDRPTGDRYLDDCLAVIKERGVSSSPKKLVEKLAGQKHLTVPLYEGLINRGILHRQTKKVFFFFDRKVYPEADPTHEAALKAHLEGVMFGNGEVSARDTILVALLQQTELLRRNFDKEKLKAHKARIKEISEGEHLAATATVETIKAVRAALMTAVIVAAVIVPATS
ncbi:GPP34 family phosphoprotein [Parvularcula marina]|uniref:GOLPH3/VPS74 family protein n=1 Tax=Parvularcula marina TaxID=2292771 RepID=UPI0035147105